MSGSPSPAAGPHLSLDLPPLAAAALLDQQALAPPPPVASPARGPRWAIVGGLLAAALVAWGIDRAFPHYPAVFGATVPFLWLGALLTANAGRRPGGSGGAGCLSVLIAALAVGFLGGLELLLGYGVAGAGWWRVGLVTALIAAFGLYRDVAEKPDPPPDHGPRIRPWAEVLRALAADVEPRRKVTGVLDLRGAQRPENVIRTGKAASGAEVAIYRDEWLRLRLPLRDGSQLRIAAIDRVKARSEYWKQGARRRKLKPGRSERLGLVEVQLIVPPAAYRPRPALPAAATVGGLAAGAAVVDHNRATVAARLDAAAPAAGDVVALVARAFAAFERVS